MPSSIIHEGKTCVLGNGMVSGTGNGFKFGPYRAEKLLEKIYEARFAFEDKKAWVKIQRNGMLVDNSWENAAKNYVQLYKWTLDN